MKVFVSYSSRDRDAVKGLSQDLQDADEQVWMDQRLAGGDAWWRAILEQIRGCDVYVLALSQNSLESKPCQAELQYAQDLGLPILPVQVGHLDSMQLNPLATVQTIDYRAPTPSSAMRLIAALNRTRVNRQPTPEPLPTEPAVPFEYLIRLYTTISNPEYLTPRDQAALVAQLEVGLGEDGQHDAARNDILMLLTKLHDREDATHRTRTDVEAILASIEAESPLQPPITSDTVVESPVAQAAKADSGTAAPTKLAPPAPGPGAVDDTVGATGTPEPATPTEDVKPSVAATPPRRSNQFSGGIGSQEARQRHTAEPPTQRRAMITLPPASPMRRAGAALIDLIPIVVIYGIAFGIAVGTPTPPHSCSPFDADGVEVTACVVDTSNIGRAAIGVAALGALGYGIWNWVHRRGRRGASIGQSVLKFKVVSSQTGQPTGWSAKPTVGLVVLLFVVLCLLALGVAALAHEAVHRTTLSAQGLMSPRTAEQSTDRSAK